MKTSLWLGALVVAALVLPGCGANEGGSKSSSAGDGTTKDGAGEGTNTGNGSCAAPWCADPRVVSGDDGKTYAGEFSIDSMGGAQLIFTGGEVLDTAEGCSPASAYGPDLRVLLELVSTDSDGTLHLQRQEGTSAILAADLTLTTALDLSGTITARLRKDEENDFARIDDPNTESGVPTWTSVFTVGGKTSVICRENENSVALQSADGTTTLLACQTQQPPGGSYCNDTPIPTP